jgi:hypothetical protein
LSDDDIEQCTAIHAALYGALAEAVRCNAPLRGVSDGERLAVFSTAFGVASAVLRAADNELRHAYHRQGHSGESGG